MLTIETLQNATEAAQAEAISYFNEYGEHPLNCGFAWVEVKGIRGNKAKMLKEAGFSKRLSGPGLYTWNPANINTQDMSVKMAGAEAYAEVLRDAGIPAEAHCRLD